MGCLMPIESVPSDLEGLNLYMSLY